MLRTWNGDTLLARALAASLALHLLFAFFVPTWLPQQSVPDVPLQAISFAHIVRARVERTVVHPSAAAAVARAHPAPRVRMPHTLAPLQKPVARARPLPQPHAGIAAVPALAPRPAITDVPASAPPRLAATPVPNSQATIAPVSSQGAGRSDRGGVLPFGASQDPVLDPAVLNALRTRFPVHATLTVTVGENGKTERVQFAPPLDPQTEREIQALLATATWDAAVCGGGVSCVGTAKIDI